MYPDSVTPIESWTGYPEKDQGKKNDDKGKNEGEKSAKTSYFLTVKDWAENSLIGGISYIATKEYYFWKLFWFAAVVTSSVYTSIGIASLLQTYYGWPVSVNINVTHANKLPFPTVTVCNLNPVRLSKLNLIPVEYQVLFNKIFENTSDSQGTGVERQAILDKFHQVYNTMPFNVQLDIGHRKNDSIMDCIFNGYACYTNDFFEWIDPVFGVCYSFNIGYDLTTNARIPAFDSYKTGPMYGLALEVSLDQDDYIADLNDLAGIKVIITPTGRMPFPADEGIYLHPGTHTSISVHLVNITRMPKPYVSDCIVGTGKQVEHLDTFAEIYNMDYHITSCLKTCYQSNVIKECGCGDPKLPINTESSRRLAANRTALYQPCLDPATMACQDDVHTKFGNDHLNCDHCRVPCVDASYGYEVSATAWPNKKYLATKLAQIAQLNPSIGEILNNSSVLPQENMLKFNVHFSELNTQVIYEQPTYTGDTLLSNIGGYLGLYLGVSLISALEVIQLAGDFICVTYRKWKRSKNDKK